MSDGPKLDQIMSVLNLDVLCYLMRFLERQELIPLMTTCHALYSTGIPALLALHINIRGERTSSSFFKFIHRDLRGRAQCLKRITLSAVHYDDAQKRGCVIREPNLSAAVMKQFIEVLLHAHYLEELNITLSHHTLELYPELPSVLESLQSLRQLSISSSDNALDVTEIVSRLHTLEQLHLDIPDFTPEVAQLLQSQSRDFKKLTIHRRQITVPATTQFPGLRYLNIDHHPDMALLPRVFPHLTHPHVQDRIFFGRESPQDIRARNLQAQAGSRAWPDLKVYTAASCRSTWRASGAASHG
ncbi:hypothetical protein OBBRIDRAFT_160669 [Obba rivulosa]|uniref:Uncharacterized protein n=1 Tax=Obba rivulosa TaxID=1052685 RepID=A0A8E2AME6_9APHY|nr:hypothetical protein OBBRIDRAFT_160669 [Obba rivulosa]